METQYILPAVRIIGYNRLMAYAKYMVEYGGYGGIWWNMVDNGRIWWNMVEYGGIWWIMGEYAGIG